jgi:hypothetical protein
MVDALILSINENVYGVLTINIIALIMFLYSIFLTDIEGVPNG